MKTTKNNEISFLKNDISEQNGLIKQHKYEVEVMVSANEDLKK